MANILKLPVQAAKLGYRRVRKRCKGTDNPNQLDLFASRDAKVLEFEAGLSPFEQALRSDERGEVKAAGLYSEAIEKEDCVADALCNLGIIESQNGNAMKAFNCFTACLGHNARHAEAHYNLGNLYFDLNDFRLAKVHYEMALEVEPSFANAYFNLALVNALNHQPAEVFRALRCYRELVTEEEGRLAEEMLENLQKSISGAKITRAG